jgi:hypothetical protein
MFHRFRAPLVALGSAAAAVALSASPAAANILSILPGSCSNQPISQPFSAWGDNSSYTPVPGGSFEVGSFPWALTGGAVVQSGSESYSVAGTGSRSLSLPYGSTATSPPSCTNLYHPTVRLFVRNTGSSTSHLTVQALYPGLLGGVQSATIGKITGSSSWKPSPAMSLLVSNLLATLSLDQTAVAFRFLPADSSGRWSIDDVYLDPYHRG